MFMIRQGDVLVRAVAAIPASAKKQKRDAGRVVLAYGEVTGHAHALIGTRVALFRDDGLGRTFLRIAGGKPEALTHEEHGTIAIPSGSYEVIRQREYTPEAIRQVAD